MVPNIVEIGGHEFLLHVSDVLLMTIIFCGGAAAGGLIWFLRNAPPQATDEAEIVARLTPVTVRTDSQPPAAGVKGD